LSPDAGHGGSQEASWVGSFFNPCGAQTEKKNKGKNEKEKRKERKKRMQKMKQQLIGCGDSSLIH
jgi:hypothetical protein